jgi:AcrR family transcriptional regulator
VLLAGLPSESSRSEISVARVLEVALRLFSSQGFGATSMRQIATESGHSVGNVYHHFANKEEIFQRLIDQYWEKVQDPALRLNELFARADFPDDLEEMAAAIEEVVEEFAPYILLIYVDVIEFRGQHIRSFYEGMAGRFEATFGERLQQRQEAGEFGDVDPMVAVMVATRWFFYYHTVEKCFGASTHFGMSSERAVAEFIRLFRYGLMARPHATDPSKPAGPNPGSAGEEER